MYKKSRVERRKEEMRFGWDFLEALIFMVDPPMIFLLSIDNVVCSIMFSHLDDSSRIAASLFFLDYEYDCHFPVSNPYISISFDMFYTIDRILDVCWSCMHTC